MQRSIGTGSVFRFKLKIRGYGYCRLVQFKDQSNENIYLVKIYDYCGTGNVKEDIPQLLKCNYLFNPVLIKYLPKIRGRGAWALVGNFEAPDDKEIPEFKNASEFPAEDESKIKAWQIVYNFGERKVRTTYNRVKHLEHFCLYTPSQIELKTSMHLLKKENKDIKKYFDIGNKDVCEEYYRTINIAPYHAVRKEQYGKSFENTPVMPKVPKEIPSSISIPLQG